MSIGDSAFSSCSSLTSLSIPNSVTGIGKCAFKGCSSLASINVDALNSNFLCIDGVLYNKSRTALLAFPARKNTSKYCIPNSVTSIEECAFYDCNSLTNIDIPSSVTSIGRFVFSGCYSLTNIHIQSTVPEKVQVGDWGIKDEQYESITLYVPSGTRWAYRHHPLFGKFKNIEIEWSDLPQEKLSPPPVYLSPTSAQTIGNTQQVKLKT